MGLKLQRQHNNQIFPVFAAKISQTDDETVKAKEGQTTAVKIRWEFPHSTKTKDSGLTNDRSNAKKG